MHKWKIPKEFINELLFRTNIVDLIKSRIILKKVGDNNFQSLCPFHNEKTPSFTVNNHKQFYYCFGCSAHGNAIDFLMNYENINFIESIEELAIINGLQIPKTNNFFPKNNIFNKHLYHMTLKKVCILYYKKLIQSMEHVSYQYLLNRGIKPTTIHYFSIGFSSSIPNYITQYFHNNLYEFNILIKLGIIVKDSKKNIYDHFRNRIIFPIRDKYGRIHGFGGRSIYPNIKPKYLNSPETLVFKKRKQIYGIFELLQNNLKPNRIIVVEGYMDVIMLTQHKIHSVVAVLGSTITIEQIKFLFRITDTIIYCYDGDQAGKNASWKSLKLSLCCLTDNKKIKFIFLPNNTDPDLIIKTEGKNNFEKRINNAITLSDFLFSTLLKKFDLSSIENKSSFTSYMLSLINKIPSIITKIYLRKKLGYQLGILDIEKINEILYKQHPKNQQIQNIKYTPMRILIGLLIQNPTLSLLTPIKRNLTNFNIPGLNLFLSLINICTNNPTYHTGQILEQYRGNIFERILRKLIIWDHMILEDKIKQVFLDALSKIHTQILEKKYQILITKERTQGLNKKDKQTIWSITKSLSQK